MAFLSFFVDGLSPPNEVRRLDLFESARAPRMGVPGPIERRARRDIFFNFIAALSSVVAVYLAA